MPSDNKEIKPGSSDHKTSPLAFKNSGIVLVPCHTWKCVTTAISGVVDFTEVPGYNLLWQMSYQRGSQKLLQGWVSCVLTACFSDFYLIFRLNEMTVLWKVYEADNFESFRQLNSLDILALCERNMENSIDPSNFLVRSHLPLIQKDFLTHIHFRDLFLRALRILTYIFDGFTSSGVLLFFPSIDQCLLLNTHSLMLLHVD